MTRCDSSAARRCEWTASVLMSLADKLGDWRDEPDIGWIELGRSTRQGSLPPPIACAAPSRFALAPSVTTSRRRRFDELTEALTAFVAELVYQVETSERRVGKAA